jgi:hypothetical protein
MERWLAITVVVPEGFREAVSNFLFEEGATGVEEITGDSGRERLKVYFPPSVILKGDAHVETS